ncbi:MAG: cytochrome, partial [Arthrobacter sp.]|nr:cytochrome [Arthrobacter sp.]
MSTEVNLNTLLPAEFDSLPVLDTSDPNLTVEGNSILAELRARGPVCRVEPIGAVGLLRWVDCDAVLRDYKTFSAAFQRPSVPGAEEETTINTLLREDPPKHTRVRVLMQQAFTPARVAAMEPHTREITRKLIDDIMSRGTGCDFLHEFALPLPSTVMSGLLGVDPSMTETFARWAASMMSIDTAIAIKDDTARQKRYEEMARDAKDMEAYLKERIEERRIAPQQDLITYLIQASAGGDRLTEREALTLMKLAVIAGNDLTTQAIALTFNSLLDHPDQMELLANDLSLAGNAFEEGLRFNGPVVTLRRQALRDVEIAGVKVPKGCLVAPVVSSANHDEAVFENPGVFDIRREIPRILSMSSGNHQCIGQGLARLEGQVALEEWFSSVSSFERAGAPTLLETLGLKGFDILPVAFRRRPVPVPKAPEESVIQQAATAEKIAAMSDHELGLDKRQSITVKVAGLWDVSSNTKLFALTDSGGGLLPMFTPGSHIVVHMRDGGKVHRNSYSLINGGYGGGLVYFIAVQLGRESKGGSKYLHEKVQRGDELAISVPANYFPTAEHAVKHLLIAGGIGVTPALSHRSHLKLQEERVELHYTFRNAETAAFVPFLTFQSDPNVYLYDGSQGQKLDIPALLRRQPEGTHVYTCGPPGMMDAAVKAAEDLGWPEETIHVERFGAGPVKGDEPFEAVCQLSGQTVQVGETVSLLDALEAAGIEIPFACRAGSCGSCLVDVRAGTVIHRDTVLSAAERAKGVT